ncbi:MAG: hypothetical protein JO023_01940 [Chloroflexi bacterium]|nr:hypothetical protein [Chloroflexota bacterium]
MPASSLALRSDTAAGAFDRAAVQRYRALLLDAAASIISVIRLLKMSC